MKDNEQIKTIYSFVGVALFIVLAFASFYLYAQMRNSLKQFDYIGKTGDMIRTMSFSGEGKEVIKPDIATVDMGVQIEKPTVAAALKEGVEKMNTLLTKLDGMGIKREDIKTTNYSINPAYDWGKGRQTLRGYVHNQNITIKIRNFEQIPDVLALAGALDLNQVGDLRFDVDNKEASIAKAKEAAIAKAKENAKKTADLLGITLGKIVSFDTGERQPVIYNAAPMYKTMDLAVGSAAMPAPEISSGTSEITVTANITYELK